MEYSPVACMRQRSRCCRSERGPTLPHGRAQPARRHRHLLEYRPSRRSSQTAETRRADRRARAPGPHLTPWVGLHPAHRRIPVAKAPIAALAYDSAPYQSRPAGASHGGQRGGIPTGAQPRASPGHVPGQGLRLPRGRERTGAQPPEARRQRIRAECPTALAVVPVPLINNQVWQRPATRSNSASSEANT